MPKKPVDPTIQKIHSRMRSGGNWLTGARIPGSIFDNPKNSQYVLQLGSLDDGTPLTFSKDGSLFTLGPAGSGKTQSFVVPNLLKWPGPAIVLDVKDELYEWTAGYREQNFGPVYKFDVFDPRYALQRPNILKLIWSALRKHYY